MSCTLHPHSSKETAFRCHMKRVDKKIWRYSGMDYRTWVVHNPAIERMRGRIKVWVFSEEVVSYLDKPIWK